MTPSEMGEAMTAPYYRTYSETVPRKWPVEPKPEPERQRTRRPELVPGAERLRAARIAKGLSSRGLGAAVGISNAQISKWEQAAYPISAKHVENVARVLGVTVEWLKEGKA